MTLRILLADNNITAQSAGMKILAAAGYEVTTVSNGVAAMKRIAEFQPDIVLLDVYLPGYGGIEICQRLKTTLEFAHISVVLTVGKVEAFRPEEGMKVKADGVARKPFEAGDLIPAIEKIADRARLRKVASSPRVAIPEVESSTCRSSRPNLTGLQPIAPVESRQLEPHVSGFALRLPMTTQSVPIHGCGAPAEDETLASAGAPQQGPEVCDVCGYVNREHAFVCQQCDVPLPSSVTCPPGAQNSRSRKPQR